MISRRPAVLVGSSATLAVHSGAERHCQGCNGTVYHGRYEPIVSVELWDQVEAVLEGRGAW